MRKSVNSNSSSSTMMEYAVTNDRNDKNLLLKTDQAEVSVCVRYRNLPNLLCVKFLNKLILNINRNVKSQSENLEVNRT